MPTVSKKRGRPQLDRAEQIDKIFAAALKVLLSHGYQKTTTLAIAKEAGVSKNTLYALFSSKESLFMSLIESRTVAMNKVIHETIEDPNIKIEDSLKLLCRKVLEILNSEISIAINRAAISAAASHDLTFSRTYMDYGREPTRKIATAFLKDAATQGHLTINNIDIAAQDLLGLLLGDLNIRQLLGMAATLTESEIHIQSDHAVMQFMRLYG